MRLINIDAFFRRESLIHSGEQVDRRTKVLDMTRFYRCPVPSLFVICLSVQFLKPIALRLSFVTVQRTDEIDSVLQLVRLLNIHQYCRNRLSL